MAADQDLDSTQPATQASTCAPPGPREASAAAEGDGGTTGNGESGHRRDSSPGPQSGDSEDSSGVVALPSEGWLRRFNDEQNAYLEACRERHEAFYKAASAILIGLAKASHR